VDSHRDDEEPHVPGPSLWPIGFAIGIACVLIGLVVSWIAAAIGAVLTAIFGFLWIRDVTASTEPAPAVEPEVREVVTAPALRADAGEAGMPLPTAADEERYPRNVFLEATTLGLGAVIGGIVTLPVLGFAVLPPFLEQDRDEADIGPIEAFPEGEYVIVTYLADLEAGEVSRRTLYVRNNGLREDGQPSFTIVSNRCVHLGCPVQPNGPINEDERQTEEINGYPVSRIPTLPAGFGCPCHGGQYDIEGNRTAGPPVRALDRYEFAIRDGRLILLDPYSVSHVEGEGGEATIVKYRLAGPGEHVDGWSALMYPIQAPS
jgi:Rieske Fe-S protein